MRYIFTFVNTIILSVLYIIFTKYWYLSVEYSTLCSMSNFEKYALKKPQVLLPNGTIDLSKWSVIACDQFTQDKQYWQKVSAFVKDAPSTLHVILPEVYLDELSESEKTTRTEKIHRTMQSYIEQSIFTAVHSFIYLERKTAYQRTRKGLIACIDLERYDWNPAASSEIRATEATILDRIPPRMHIREGAALELPHIMLLIDDKDRLLIEKTGEAVKRSEHTPIYDFPLMMNSGHLRGWAVPDTLEADMLSALETLQKQNTSADGTSFLFAVGDGNHSLATAKTVWKNMKKQAGGTALSNGAFSIPAALENNPLRYALVELVNIYDKGLTFEPVHRVLFNTDCTEVLDFVRSKLGGTITSFANRSELQKAVESRQTSFGFISEDTLFCLESDLDCLGVSALQPVLDEFIAAKKIKIDYIHGADETFSLAKKPNTVSILCPPIAKENFFSTIVKTGSLPRKSFSMGEASEKRFYLECRKLSR